MEKLIELRDIRKEILNMEFNFRNVQRIMHLVYATKDLFESSSAVPNKEIALHQTNKVIKYELLKLITAENEKDIKRAFEEVIENFKLVLVYIA